MTNDTTPEDQPMHTTLSDAAIQWGKPLIVKKLKRLSRLGYSEMTALGHVLGQETREDRLRDPYCYNIDILRNELIEKLRAEELVAIGFSSTSPPDVPRIQIHCGRWRILKPDFSDNSARGGGLELYDILVTTPQKTAPSNTPHPVLTLSDNAKTVLTNSGQAELSDLQYKLLRLLVVRVQARTPLVSQKEILSELYAGNPSPDNARSQILKLRAKLKSSFGIEMGDQRLIETRQRQGYVLRLSPDQLRIE